LLELPHVESGTLLLDLTPVDLVALVRRVAASVQATTEEHQLELRSHAPVMAVVDIHGIEEVMGDLMENAVKYSPDGGRIEVEITVNDAAVARLTVRDYGVGVEPENREHLFQRFYQAHPGLHFAGQVGLGLGLYISRRIVEQHGGQLNAEFPSDGGSLLVVCLPTARS
jgi:signal transduction histidine kinase